jgi:hypothetical protein
MPGSPSLDFIPACLAADVRLSQALGTETNLQGILGPKKFIAPWINAEESEGSTGTNSTFETEEGTEVRIAVAP